MKILLFPVFLVLFFWAILDARSKFLREDVDFDTPKQELLTLFPHKKKDIQSIFRETPFYTNIRFPLRVKKKTLHKMFTNIPFSVNKAKSYGYDGYDVTTLSKNLHKIDQKPDLTGTIEMLMGDEKNNHYIFLIKGVYKGFLIIRGQMIIDIHFTQEESYQDMEVKSYITFENDVIFETLKRISFIPKINKKIDRLVEYNIKKIVYIGRKTALKINREALLPKTLILVPNKLKKKTTPAP